jgi:hypothetical protein
MQHVSDQEKEKRRNGPNREKGDRLTDEQASFQHYFEMR